MMLYTMLYSHRQLNVRVGGFIDLSLETLIVASKMGPNPRCNFKYVVLQVLKTAWSYFLVLNRFQGEP